MVVDKKALILASFAWDAACVPFLTHDIKTRQILDSALRVATFPISVLIQGESGTGKELLAREIHQASGRAGAFIALNCANLTESLLESELFGYQKGAFTGALQNKMGLIEAAQGGTLFLDEIAELPYTLQAKLLRVLEERTVRPLGAVQERAVDFRLISATHQDLRAAIAERRFRADLYYRIQEVTILIPPLRERPSDIEKLAAYYLKSSSEEFGFEIRTLSREALQKILAYSFPGNVRELRNLMRTAVILSPREVVQPEEIRLLQLSGSIVSEDPPVEAPIPAQARDWRELDGKTLRELTQEFERSLVEGLLKDQGLTQAQAAEKLGISVRTLQRILIPSPLAETRTGPTSELSH